MLPGLREGTTILLKRAWVSKLIKRGVYAFSGLYGNENEKGMGGNRVEGVVKIAIIHSYLATKVFFFVIQRSFNDNKGDDKKLKGQEHFMITKMMISRIKE